jgi:hypothetical protein
VVKGIQWIIDRLVERFVPVIGGMFSSTVETAHALTLAEQLNELEEAARHYEAGGKMEIAATLRRRASQLATHDPASLGVDLARNLAAKPLVAPTVQSHSTDDVARLPQFREPSPKRRRTQSASNDGSPSS